MLFSLENEVHPSTVGETLPSVISSLFHLTLKIHLFPRLTLFSTHMNTVKNKSMI